MLTSGMGEVPQLVSSDGWWTCCFFAGMMQWSSLLVCKWASAARCGFDTHSPLCSICLVLFLFFVVFLYIYIIAGYCRQICVFLHLHLFAWWPSVFAREIFRFVRKVLWYVVILVHMLQAFSTSRSFRQELMDFGPTKMERQPKPHHGPPCLI